MRVLWITAVVIVIDQVSKVAVLRSMSRHESIPILGDWLKLTFTENPGMAFGINFGPRGLVTIFSIVATALIIGYLYQVRKGYHPYVASLALILGGALGNIIDRVFYGVFLGYDSLFTGKVVDFIHVNLWRGYLPEGLPFIGGSYLALFPIWNVADMAIVLGVVGILLFQKTFHQRHLEASQPVPTSPDGGAAAPDLPGYAGPAASPAAAVSAEPSAAAPPVWEGPAVPPQENGPATPEDGPISYTASSAQDAEVLDEKQKEV